MQIIETTGLGVRANVVTLVRSESPLRFVLFPMIHMAEQSFYDEVGRRVGECDVIVAEGVGPGSAVGAAIMAAYWVNERFGRTGLVVQNVPRPRTGAPVVRPDLSGKEFQGQWRSLPLLLRVAAALAFPVILLGTVFLGTRRVLASQMPLEDLPSRDEILQGDELTDRFDAVMLGKRDDRLCQALADLHQQRSAEPIRVAVVYGASHMRAVVEYLGARFRYWPQSGEWLIVFSL